MVYEVEVYDVFSMSSIEAAVSGDETYLLSPRPSEHVRYVIAA